MSKELNLVIEENLVGKRLDKAILESFEEFTRSRIHKLMEDQQVFVDGRLEPKRYNVKLGDKVKIIIAEKKELINMPQDIPLDIIHEDEYILVIN